MAFNIEVIMNNLQQKISPKAIIKKAIKSNQKFQDLSSREQRAVLKYISDNNINYHFFAEKGYNVLRQSFFAKEFVANDISAQIETKEFITFEELYIYTNGDIYTDACYYGYEFSASEVKQFNIKLSKINFNSFVNDTIDKNTFKSIQAAQLIQANVTDVTNKNIYNWFCNNVQINTWRELQEKANSFCKKFNFYGNNTVFYSIIIQKGSENIKDVIVKTFLEEENSTITFEDILFYYGEKTARDVIINLKNSHTHRREVERYTSYLNMITRHQYIVSRESGFDEYKQVYFVTDSYRSDLYRPVSHKKYFISFEDFTKYLGNDLRNCDLRKAPIKNLNPAIFFIDTTTQLPIISDYKNAEIIKIYQNNKFFVIQNWLDANGNLILRNEFKTEFFCDFVHYLNNDISDADLIMCDGVENIVTLPHLKFDRIKVRSNVAKMLKIDNEPFVANQLDLRDFSNVAKNEQETTELILLPHTETDDYNGHISYISDIHLLHRFIANKCESKNDCKFITTSIVDQLYNNAQSITLFAGDISSDIDSYRNFVLRVGYYSRGYSFFTLGNHELWAFSKINFPQMCHEYKKILSQNNIKLVQNNLFYFTSTELNEITEEKLSTISTAELRAVTRNAKLIIFGGIGFSGHNSEFNANNGIYRNSVSREQEIEESKKFDLLYQKIAQSLYDRNVIILTHMPLSDWAEDATPVKGFVYVSGHNHHNYFFDDGKTRIYNDNQVGYKGKQVAFKTFQIDFGYEYFADYKDGIYEISRDDYENYYRGINEGLTFNRKFKKLYMLKREGVYMFLMETEKGTLSILNGGAIRKAFNRPLEFFYENLPKYSQSVKLYLKEYNDFQKRISTEIKRLGGDGFIHGCIVDIDFLNHVYINPLDRTITPYYATSMTDKYIYKNIPSLLKAECPQLYANLTNLLENTNKNSLIFVDKNIEITPKTIYYSDTDIYRASRIIRGLQYTTKYNVVRLWNDKLVETCSKENGRLIVQGLLYPEE